MYKNNVLKIFIIIYYYILLLLLFKKIFLQSMLLTKRKTYFFQTNQPFSKKDIYRKIKFFFLFLLFAYLNETFILKQIIKIYFQGIFKSLIFKIVIAIYIKTIVKPRNLILLIVVWLMFLAGFICLTSRTFFFFYSFILYINNKFDFI